MSSFECPSCGLLEDVHDEMRMSRRRLGCITWILFLTFLVLVFGRHVVELRLY